MGCVTFFVLYKKIIFFLLHFTSFFVHKTAAKKKKMIKRLFVSWLLIYIFGWTFFTYKFDHIQYSFVAKKCREKILKGTIINNQMNCCMDQNNKCISIP